MPTQPKARKRPWIPEKKNQPHQGRTERSKEYDTARWKRFRLEQLAIEPCCRICAQDNRVTAATVVDHIEQVIHGGAFYSHENVRSLCYHHHQRVSALQRHGKTL